MSDGITMRLDSSELTGYLQKMEGRLNAKKDFFTIVVSILHNSIIANFRRAGRPKRWVSLSPMTLAVRKWRAKKGIGRGFRNIQGLDQPILMDSGKLFQSIGSVNQITSNYCEYGTRDFRAPILQGTGFGKAYGTKIRIPARVIRPIKAKFLHWITPEGKDVFAKKANIPARDAIIPGRPFILFQDEDVRDITAYAATFALTPEEKLPTPPKL